MIDLDPVNVYLVFFSTNTIFGSILLHAKICPVVLKRWYEKLRIDQNPDWILLSTDEFVSSWNMSKIVQNVQTISTSQQYCNITLSTHLELVLIGWQCKMLTNPSQLFPKWDEIVPPMFSTKSFAFFPTHKTTWWGVFAKWPLPISRCFCALQAFEDAFKDALFLLFTILCFIVQVHLKINFCF